MRNPAHKPCCESLPKAKGYITRQSQRGTFANGRKPSRSLREGHLDPLGYHLS